MGRFTPRRRSTACKPGDYGRVLPARVWQGRRRPFFRFPGFWRPAALFAVLCLVWTFHDPVLIEPPKFLSTEPEPVSGPFTLCGPGRARNCVVDGDTFKLGERKIRLIGIDAPETHPPRCAAEARIGEEATRKLLALLNQGSFIIRGRIDEPLDRYGRELRSATRQLADGTEQSISAEMIASGTVRRYLGGFRDGWC